MRRTAANDQVEARRATDAEPAADRERGNPLHRVLVHLGLPTLISIALHVLVVVGASFYTFSVFQAPRATFADVEAGLVQRGEDAAAAELDWDAVPESFDAPLPTDVELPELGAGLAALGEPAEDLGRLTDPGGGAVPRDDEIATGEFGRSGLSLLGSGGGAAKPGTGGFGAGLGTGHTGGGEAGIYRLRVRADTVVYVLDFSGSIIVAVSELKRELKRSVSRLAPQQLFNAIIFFGEDEEFRTVAFSSRLEPASSETRRRFFDWLDQQTPRGQTQPLPAIRRALALRPDVIFFFSDGLFPDDVVAEIAAANRDAGARIMCLVFDELLLQYTGALPRETEGARRLRRIAEQNGGRMKMVTGADVSR